MAKKQAKRRANELRVIRITRGFTDYPAGSVLMEMGATRVLCTASMEAELPKWRRESELGWVTAEYSMLPGATPQRKARSRQGHTDNRGLEIQRLVGRVLRGVVDLEKLGANTITLDCDVLQADGGTRVAAITGSYVALVDAVRFGMRQGLIEEDPVREAMAAVSVGMVGGKVRLDLDYELDSAAEVDMNVAMTESGNYVELQGTGEESSFSEEELQKMLGAARRGIKQILAAQAKALQSRLR